uniref:Putative secreted protein n=1 Tax=Amblyomma triste TaxID=251400 RepID=A0A023G2D5_AMBTT
MATVLSCVLLVLSHIRVSLGFGTVGLGMGKWEKLWQSIRQASGQRLQYIGNPSFCMATGVKTGRVGAHFFSSFILLLQQLLQEPVCAQQSIHTASIFPLSERKEGGEVKNSYGQLPSELWTRLFLQSCSIPQQSAFFFGKEVFNCDSNA